MEKERTNGWEEVWQDTMKRYRLECPEYDERATKRRCNANRALSETTFLKKLIEIVYPVSIAEAPDEDTRAKLIKHRESMAQPKALRKMCRANPKLPVHPEYMSLLLKGSTLLKHERDLLARFETPRPKMANFVASLHVLRKMCNVDGKSSNEIDGDGLGTLSSAMSLEDATLFCVQKDAGSPLRIQMLYMTGFLASKQQLMQRIDARLSAKRAFASLQAQIHGDVKVSQWTFEMYQQLLEVFGSEDEMARMSAKTMDEKLEACKNKRVLFQLIKQIMQNKGKSETFVQLEQFQNPKCSNVTWKQRFVSLSPFCNELYNRMLCEESKNKKTSFVEEYMKRKSRHFCKFMFDIMKQHETNDLKEVLHNATSAEWEDMILKSARDIHTDVSKSRSANQSHQCAQHVQQCIGFLHSTLRPFLSCSIEGIQSKTILRQIENKRLENDGSNVERRVFTDEEMARLEHACQDPVESLLLHILKEVGLRNRALSHLTYDMLMDENDNVRAEARVPEKGLKKRCFMINERLAVSILRLGKFWRSMHTSSELRKKFYVFNIKNPSSPVSDLNMMFRRIASRAGVHGKHVHLHSFRHTLVSKLVNANNSMDVISKFLGHNDTKTTAMYYFVPTAEELNKNLIDPFASEYHVKELHAKTIVPIERQLIEAKLKVCHKIIDKLSEKVDASSVIAGFDELKKRVAN
jgi:integrase